MEAELIYADRRTDMTKLKVAFRNFVNTPESTPLHSCSISSAVQNAFPALALNFCERQGVVLHPSEMTALSKNHSCGYSILCRVSCSIHKPRQKFTEKLSGIFIPYGI